MAYSVSPGPSLHSIREHWDSIIFVACSVAVGTIGWSGEIETLPLATLFPLFWAASRSRLVSLLVSAGYFLAASRGLPQGLANYYASDLWPGLLLWIAASSIFAGVHAVVWTRRPGWARGVRYAIAGVVMAVPPCGIIGWAHPITAAGVLLPGWGWIGLVAIAAGLVVMTTSWWPAAAIVLGGFWLWSAASWTNVSLPDGWVGVDMRQGQNLSRNASLEAHRALIDAAKASAGRRARIVVLPESALGFWTPTVRDLWRSKLAGSGTIVLAGAAVIEPDGYDNVLVVVSQGEGEVLYRERMPVPVSMWQPWQVLSGGPSGARANFFSNPIVRADGKRVAVLICYEQLIIWPVLQSMLHKPDLVVAVGNGWWTEGTSIVPIQKAATAAWARLFGLPVVTAFNT